MFVVATLGVLIVGCGENDAPGSNPNVEYGGSTYEDNNLANYTNADWLYQNYFGEYGLPDELKTMMTPELEMIANGFALQHSRGEGVNSSISQLNTAMQMLYYSGQLGTSMRHMVKEYNTGIYNAPNNLTEYALLPVESQVISAQAQKNIDKAEKLEEEYIAKQEQLVIDHNLPYSIPSRRTKYIIYSPSMKSGKGNGGGNGGGTRKWGIDSWSWQEADFTWVNGAGGIGHMGLVTNTDGSLKDIIDANTGTGVKRHQDGLDAWMNEGGWTRVEGWRYRPWGRYSPKRIAVIEYADGLVGRSYNWKFWDKKTEDSVYCSQLVWRAYYEKGVDLDSNEDLIVWPRDITKHSDVHQFNYSE